MRSANEHLRPEELDGFVDRELPLEETAAVEQHIAECHTCSLRVLSSTELKRAVAGVGQPFQPSAAALARLTQHVRGSTPPQSEKSRTLHLVRPTRVWMALAACLLLTFAVGAWQLRRGTDVLSAELLDQHLSTLSAAAAPQILSTDRHTVKPWFQGKLPFSFNLPEPNEYPPDTVLRGADLAYLHNQPAALLLFTMRKHQVSVFLTERNGTDTLSTPRSRSGFNIRTAVTPHLQLLAISDVNARDLDALVALLLAQQTHD